MSKTVTKYREAKNHNIPLVRDRAKIIDLTGDYSENPLPRCGKCGGIALTLRDHTGAEVVKACKACKLVWWKIEVKVMVTKTEYLPYGEEVEA